MSETKVATDADDAIISAAPADAVQDDAGAPATTSAPPDTAIAVEAARAAYAEANAALGTARDAATAADQVHAEAQTTRRRLIDGGDADDAALDASRATVALAADRAETATGRVAAAHRQAEAAEIALLTAQATHLTERHAAAVRRQLAAAAEAIDARFAALQATINCYDDAGFDRTSAASSAHQHNQQVAYAAHANGTLRSLEPRDWPQTRMPHIQLPAVHAILIGSPKQEEIYSRIRGSVATRIRSVLGLPPGGGTTT